MNAPSFNIEHAYLSNYKDNICNVLFLDNSKKETTHRILKKAAKSIARAVAEIEKEKKSK